MIFRGPDGRSAFAKPRRASRTKLAVKVPVAVGRLVARKSGSAKPTRFKLRVLAGKFSKFTSRRLSPVVVPASSGSGPGGGGGSGGAAGCPAHDYDGDLLPNALEAQLKLDPCIADTDGDSVEDGYEYQAAVDLNHNPRSLPLPYPGKRPYPNPLDPSRRQAQRLGLRRRRSDAARGVPALGLATRATAPRGPAARRRWPASSTATACSARSTRRRRPLRPTCWRTGCSTSTTTACSRTTSVTPTPTASGTGTRSAAG